MVLNRLIILRHAESRENKRHRVQGLDDPELQRGYKKLTEDLTDRIVEGERLIRYSGQVYVFSSGMKRSYYTAQWMHSHLANRYKIQADLLRRPDLNERGQGVLEGLSYEKVVEYLLREKLPPGTTLEPKAKSIYPHLFSSDVIPGGEKLERAKSRLERFAVEELQQREGIGFIVGHSISGMNYLDNLLTSGNILGDGNYKHFPNLTGVRLEIESFGRYRETGRYEPQNRDWSHANGAQVTPPLERVVGT